MLLHNHHGVDPELLRVTQLLSTDDELVSYIRKLVLSRLTVDTLADKNWMKAVVDFSVEEAIKKLEIDRMVINARQAADDKTSSSPELKPSFSDSEPQTNKGRRVGRPQQKSSGKGSGSKAGGVTHKESASDEPGEKPVSPMKPITAASVGSYGNRKNSTVNAALSDDVASPALSSPESPRKKGILIDDDVLMESAPESVAQSFEISSPDSPARSEYMSDASGDSSGNYEPDEAAVDVDSDEDTVPVYSGADADGDPDGIALDDSDDSDASRHVRFSSALENVKYIENVHRDLEPEEKEKLFFTHIGKCSVVHASTDRYLG
jgi:hypothetical protein